MEKEPIVLIDSPEAAVFESRTLTGWWSRTGHFFGSRQGAEDTARYNGATHKKCDCGEVTDKYRTRCNSCQAKADYDKMMAMPYVIWDGTTPLWSDEYDKYFFDVDDIYQLVDDHDDLNFGDELNFIVCQPQYFHQIDSSIWEDVLPSEDYGGDGELPKEMQQKINELNEIINKMAPASWLPGKTRTSIILQP